VINWHRLFGQALIDLFTDTTYVVELEKDLSLKQQFLDIVIIKKTGKTLAMELPDGFDNLKDYSLVTFKSLREPLDVWAIQELIGHYVNYRKQVSGDKLLPKEKFGLYAIATRYPRDLIKQTKPKIVQPGVYDLDLKIGIIRIIAFNKIPKTKNNALWCMFSAVAKTVDWGWSNYKLKSITSTIFNQLYEYYQLEGIKVAYTRVDYERDMKQEFLGRLSLEERLSGLKPDEVLSHYKPEEVFKFYKPEERLAGLTEEQIRAYLEKKL